MFLSLKPYNIKVYDENVEKDSIGEFVTIAMKGAALLLSLLICLVVISPGCITGGEDVGGDLVPLFSITGDDGITYSSEDLIGVDYILHFSASWCNKCRPTMHAVANQLDDSQYIIVSTDASDTNKLSDWHLQVNDSKEDSTVDAPFTVGVGLSESFEINNTPTLILINAKGEVVSKHLGTLTEEENIEAFWAQLD